MDALTDVMRGVLNESEQKNTELREYYKPLRETLRGTTLEVRRDSAEFAELMNAYGDGKNGRQWGNVRKALFGRLNVRLTDGAGNWDTMQAELAESWPGTFDAENTDITAFTDAVLGVYQHRNDIARKYVAGWTAQGRVQRSKKCAFAAGQFMAHYVPKARVQRSKK